MKGFQRGEGGGGEREEEEEGLTEGKEGKKERRAEIKKHLHRAFKGLSHLIVFTSKEGIARLSTSCRRKMT